MPKKLSIKQLGLATFGVLVVLAVLSFILALLPLQYTPPVVAGLIILAFLLGGIGVSAFQNWSVERTREKNYRQARRSIGLEDDRDSLEAKRRWR